MAENILTIGKMAKLSNLSIQTLRYYDKLGLFTPKFVDDMTGYRYYHIEQIAILDIIKYLKICGLNLLEISHILYSDIIDEQNLIKVLKEKRKQVEIAMEELCFQKMAIEKVLDSFEFYHEVPEMGSILLEQFSKKYAMIFKGKYNYYQDTLLYEKGLLDLKEKMKQKKIPYFFSLNPGAITRKKYLKKSELFCNELFIYVDKVYCNNRVSLTEIPSGVYACIYCNDVMNETMYVRALIDYIEAHDMEIIGDCIQEDINDIAAIRRNRKHLLMRIRIPVRFRKA